MMGRRGKRSALRAGVVVAALLAATAAVIACGAPGDSLAVLEAVLCAEDADCVDGACSSGGEEVEVERILARAVESSEASRHAPEGLFVLASWEVGRSWIELELDAPTDREGRVDLGIRYTEHVAGELRFTAVDARGRVVLVSAPDGEMPFAARLELRFESGDGEVRRLHQGTLEPQEVGIRVPEPSLPPVDWEEEGVELVILESPARPFRQPTPSSEVGDSSYYYVYDYREEPDPYATASVGCSVEDDDGCEGDDYEEPYYEEDYYDAESTGCGGDDSGSYDDGSGGCSGDSSSDWSCKGDDYYGDDPYYDSSSSDWSCEGDDYDSSSSDWSCEGDGYGDDYSSGGDDWSCEGDGGGDYDSSSDWSCESDAELAAAARRRQELRSRVRGHLPPHPARRALSFLPVAFALALTRALRGR